MLLQDHCRGGNAPFRGDRTIVLASLPAGAHATAATLVLTPSDLALKKNFEETFFFDSTGATPNALLASDWGLTRNPQVGFVEVDFHNRYTLAGVTGITGLNQPTLQVDLGGVFVDINNHGAVLTPQDARYPITAGTSVLPGLTVSKFRLSERASSSSSSSSGSPINADVQTVSVRSVPTNISIRIGKLPPFWTIVGELSTARTSPDFSAAINAFLLNAVPQNGFYTIPFTLHSDSIARLDVDLSLQFVIRQPALPPHLSQVNLPFDISTQPGIKNGLTAVALPRQAVPVAGQTGVQIRGQFEPTRVALGTIGQDPPAVPATVSPQVSLAQAFTPHADVSLLSIDLRLGNTTPGTTGLNVAVREDEGGKPSQTVLGAAAVPVAKPLRGQSGWNTVTLPAPVRLVGGKRYWLILQSLTETAEWSAAQGAAEGQPPLQASRDGGLSWRIAITQQTIGPLAAFFRLRHRPVQFTIPIQLEIGSGAKAVRRTLHEFAPLGKIEFAFDFAAQLASYLASVPPEGPCGSGNLVTNGRFEQPPPDDATARLFGQPTRVGRPPQLVGSVDLSAGADLSVERFITLSFLERTPIRIDCSGLDPAHTSLQEIVDAINRATRPNTASATEKMHLQLDNSRVTLYLLWARTQAPDGWEGRAGQIYRVGGPRINGLTFAVLADPNVVAHTLTIDGTSVPVAPSPPDRAPVLRCGPATVDTSEPARLSQRLPAVADCAYHLQVRYQFTPTREHGRVPDPGSLSRWEVGWLDRNNVPLRTDTGPFPVSADPKSSGPRLVEASVTAPANAVAAELRFVHPLSDTFPLILEEVSFGPQEQLLANTSLDQWASTGSGATPAGWTIVSGLVIPATDPVTNNPIGAVLRGDGPDDAVLAQAVTVAAGRDYTLAVKAQYEPSSSASPSQPSARVEIHWLVTGRPTTPVVIPLDGSAFSQRGCSGSAPAGATLFVLRIIQPRDRGNLTLQSSSFIAADLVSVPLTFLSETPGQLTVSNFQVSYDTPAPPAPLQPRAPIQPAPASGSASPISPVAPQVLATGSESSSSATHPAAKLAPAVPDLEQVVSVPEAEPATPLPAAPATVSTREPPLIGVPGVGPLRAWQLQAAGIVTVAQLAATSPGEVAHALGDIDVEEAIAMVDAAILTAPRRK
jgi:predicted flap endonuclease-1-like 5' DNA nuclease